MNEVSNLLTNGSENNYINVCVCIHTQKQMKQNIQLVKLNKKYTDRSSLHSSYNFSVNLILYQNEKFKKCLILGKFQKFFEKSHHNIRSEETFVVFKIRLNLLTHQNCRSHHKSLPNKAEHSEWVLWFPPTSIYRRNVKIRLDYGILYLTNCSVGRKAKYCETMKIIKC